MSRIKKSAVARREKSALSREKIEKFLKKSKTYLGAIYINSFNKFLVNTKRYSLVIYCNFHWFCIYSTEKTFEIFDPLGFLQKAKCFSAKFFTFLKSHIAGKTLKCNPQIQSRESFFCGYYVVFYIYMRDLGHSFIDILNKFSSNFVKNDSFVVKAVNKMFKR